MLGRGLLTDSGNTWKKHRHMLNPAFSTNSVKNYLSIFNKHAGHSADIFLKLKDSGPVDIIMKSVRMTSDIIAESIFGLEMNFYKEEYDNIISHTPRGPKLLYERIVKPWLENDTYYFNFTESGKKIKHIFYLLKSLYNEKITKYIAEYINNKKQMDDEVEKNNKNPLQIMADCLEAGELTLEEVFDECYNIYTPGVDSLYSHLSFLLLMLGMHKRCQDLVYQEIKETFGDDLEAPVTTESLSKMTYLSMCMKEVTRLYPTGPLQMRSLTNDFHLKSRNMVIPAGTALVICNFFLHRNPKYWDKPNEFMPERFSPEVSAKRPKYAYIPFSAGLRKSIAQTFSTDYLKTAAVHILRKVELHSDLRMQDLNVVADISTRSVNGYHLEIRARNISNQKKI